MNYIAVQLVGGASRGKLRHALHEELVPAIRKMGAGARLTVCGRPARLVDGTGFARSFDEVEQRFQCARCRAEVARREEPVITTAPPVGFGL